MIRQHINLRCGRPQGFGDLDTERAYEQRCAEMRAVQRVRYAAGPHGYVLPGGRKLPAGAEITPDMMPGESLGERMRVLHRHVFEQRILEAL